MVGKVMWFLVLTSHPEVLLINNQTVLMYDDQPKCEKMSSSLNVLLEENPKTRYLSRYICKPYEVVGNAYIPTEKKQ